jgi:hypothetical protein
MSHLILSICLPQDLVHLTRVDLKRVMVELENKWLKSMEFKREKKSIVVLERLLFKIGTKTKSPTWVRNKLWEKEKFKTSSNSNKIYLDQRKHRIMVLLLQNRMQKVIVQTKHSKEMLDKLIQNQKNKRRKMPWKMI